MVTLLTACGRVKSGDTLCYLETHFHSNNNKSLTQSTKVSLSNYYYVLLYAVYQLIIRTREGMSADTPADHLCQAKLVC